MTDLDSSDAVVAPGALGWLRTVLWGPDVDIAFAAGAEGDVTFLAEPSASAPELLVPSGPAAAVAPTWPRPAGGMRPNWMRPWRKSRNSSQR